MIECLCCKIPVRQRFACRMHRQTVQRRAFLNSKEVYGTVQTDGSSPYGSGGTSVADIDCCCACYRFYVFCELPQANHTGKTGPVKKGFLSLWHTEIMLYGIKFFVRNDECGGCTGISQHGHCVNGLITLH